jgi:hypothetical protein
LRYTEGLVNRWPKLERPGVYIKAGHVVAIMLALIDVEKEQEHGHDGHGSKVIVIPFDGRPWTMIWSKLRNSRDVNSIRLPSPYCRQSPVRNVVFIQPKQTLLAAFSGEFWTVRRRRALRKCAKSPVGEYSGPNCGRASVK